MKKITLVLLLIVLGSHYAIAQSQFTWNNLASGQRTNLSQTVSGVTASVVRDLNTYISTTSSCGIVQSFVGDLSGNLTINFSQPIDVTSIYVANNICGSGINSSFIFTPIGGSNSIVDQALSSGTVTVNWQRVTGFRVSEPTGFGLIVDTIIFNTTDTTAPIPNTTPLPDVMAQCEVTSLTAPTAIDDSAGVITGTTTTTFPITTQGTTLVTWTYDDGNGNTSTQTQNVIIDDTTAPVPDVASLTDVTAECQVTSLTAPTATDNCAGSITATSDVTLPITTQGTTLVTWTYNDGNGNTSTQTQDVIIDDTTAPVPDATTLADVTAQCEVASLTAPTATDNCGGTITATTDAAFPITTQGTTTVTWTYDDGNGNTSTQMQNVIIEDTTAPSIACPSTITSNSPIVSFANPTATDNCDGTLTALAGMTYLGMRDGKNLFISNNSFSGAAAFADAVSKGGTVVTIPNAAFNAYLASRLVALSIPEAHIGLSDAMNEGNFVWQDGSPVTYANFRRGEPNNTDGGEDYVTMLSGGTWNDVGARGTGNSPYILQLTAGATIQTAGLPSGDTFPIGTTTNTFVAYDAQGNNSTCSFDVTITDNTAPVADVTNLLDVTAQCEVTTLTAPTATDDFAGSITATSDVTLPITTQGTTVVTWTYDDGNGNISTQTQNVIIEDTTNPIAVAQDISILLDSNGSASIVASDIDNGSTDNCAINTVTLDITDFTCADLGANTVTLTVTDNEGNTDTATAVVTVIDNEAPLALANDFSITNYNWSNGTYAFLPGYVNNGSTDNCGIATIELARDENSDSIADSGFGDRINVTCADVGKSFDYLFRVTDNSGNQTVITRTLTVEDNLSPTVITQNITIQLDANGAATITAADVNNGSTDDCAIDTVTLDITDFTCADLGANTVTLTVTDNEGNTSSQTATVTVVDNLPPVPVVATLADVTAQCEVASLTAPTATDNCAGTITATSDATLPITAQGTTMVTWTYDDGNGNTFTQTQNVVIDDTTAPVITLNGNATEIILEGNSFTDAGVTVTDNCAINAANVIVGGDIVDTNTPGTYVITYNLSDAGGNNAAQVIRTVIIDAAPTLTSVSIASDNNDSAFAKAGETITLSFEASEDLQNSPLVTIAGQPANVVQGANPQNWTATYMVPDIASLDQTALPDGIVSFTIDYSDLNGFSGSTITETTNDSKVTIRRTPPTVITQDITVMLDANGNATITPQEIDNGSSVNPCVEGMTYGGAVVKVQSNGGQLGGSSSTFIGAVSNGYPMVLTAAPLNRQTSRSFDGIKVRSGDYIVLRVDSSSPARPGASPFFNTSQGRYLWAGYNANGRFATRSEMLIVQDGKSSGELIDFNKSFSLRVRVNGSYLGRNGSLMDDFSTPQDISIQLVSGNPGTDNPCAIASLTLDQDTFDCSNLGANTVTLTATGNAGNTSSQTATVTVVDNLPPVPDVTTLADVTAQCEVTSLTAPTATDNCGGTITATSDAVFPIVGEGTTTLVTWTYDDGNGNISTQTQNVVIDDTTAPVPDVATLADVKAQCEVTSLVAPTATDNCAGTITVTSDATLPIVGEGTTTVTWTYDDGNGNTSTQTQNVVIDDTTAPVPNTAQLSSIIFNCEVPSLEIPTATDNCVGTIDATTTASFPITASQVITWTYDDGNGNISTQEQLIIVELREIDPIDSVVVCDAFTLPTITGNFLTGNQAYYTQPGGNGTAFAEAQTLTAADFSSYPVTLYIYDADNQGCAAETSFELTINQTPTAPTLPDVTICEQYVLPALSVGNYFTAPNGNGMALNQGDVINSSQTIFVYAEDASGNCSDESSFTVTITPNDVINATMDDASFVYDGTVRSLEVSNIPQDASVVYTNNDQTQAGTYTVTAVVSSATASCSTVTLTATLTIEKAPQTITFEPIMRRNLLDDPDFQLNASSSSGLPITYTATGDAAAVSATGFVTLENEGVVTITASQPGNNNYLPATAVEQDLEVFLNSDTSIDSITINGDTFNNPQDDLYYVIECDDQVDLVEVSWINSTGATFSMTSPMTIETPAPGIYRRQILITAQNGRDSRILNLAIEKRFVFEAIVEQKYGNTLVVNNNPANNGGYSFVSYQWFKNDRLVSTDQFFSEGDRPSDQLDPNATYRVKMTMANGDVLQTCESTVRLGNNFSLRILQNPVVEGNLQVHADFPVEELRQAQYHIYDQNGRLLQSVSSPDQVTTISLPSNLPVGVYRLIFVTDRRTEQLNFINN